ncbi:MAG: methyl-accepting chemotaxis protein [Bacillota bacterium]|nr:methyl-accepting chemotaxis protein [Bacillota bacterium]
MKQKSVIKGGISFKIIATIVGCSMLVALLVGGVSIIDSRAIVEKQSKENLLLTAQNKASEFNVTMLNVESSVDDLADTLSSSFNKELAEKDSNYINNYEQSIQTVVKSFGVRTQGDMSVYFYMNPDITGGVHGAWYATKNDDKKFEMQPLGDMSQFNPQNEDMNWYYKPIKEHKALWLEPYVDPDLKISMISYVVPIYQGDTLIGVTGMDINFNYFKNIVSGTKVYSTGYAVLLNKDNHVLIHPTIKQGENFASTQNGVFKNTANKLSANKSGIDEYAYKGSNKIIAYSHLANGFTYLIDVPQSEVMSQISHLTLVACLMIILGIIVAVIFAEIISKLIANPIKKATILIDKTSKLNIEDDKSFDAIMNNKDETGMMVRSITNMRSLLRNIVKELIEDAEATSNSANALLSATNEASKSINEISRATDELAKRSSQQAALTQEGMSSLLNLANELDIVTNSSNFVKETLNETNELNKKAIISIEKLHDQFKQNNSISQEVTSNIDLLASKSGSIGEIISTIKYIAEQTNLLALNAAIEAARAGEHGKGFAVVAEEIRKLSEQTSISTKDIEDIIHEIQVDIGNAKNKIDNSNTIISSSNEALAITDASFNVINEAISRTSIQIEQLITSISKIGENKNEVVRDIEEMSAITEESAAASQEVAASLESQTEIIKAIFESSDNLNKLVDTLESVIKEFQI